MCIVDQGYNLVMTRLWKTWPAILSVHLSPKRARPGATRSIVADLEHDSFRSVSGIYGRVIGLGQGMTYIPEESKVIYQSKDGKKENIFDALEWLAAMPACACRTQTGAPTRLPCLKLPHIGLLSDPER